MNLGLDKKAWKRIALGDVARASKERVNPASGEVQRYVAGQHMDTDDLTIHRWGEVGDGYLGPAFHRRFHEGQILYGSRRTYLRKVAVAEFGGVTANTTFVVETKDDAVVRQKFLPFIMSSRPFHAFAVKESKGSVNPYVNWSDIERYEFDLPSLDEQERLAEILWTVERNRREMQRVVRHIRQTRATWLHSLFEDAARGSGFVELNSLIEHDRPVCYGILMPGPEVEGGPFVVDVKDYPTGAIRLASVRRCGPHIESEFKRSRLRTGDVLLSI